MDIFFADLRGLNVDLQAPTESAVKLPSPASGRLPEGFEPDAAEKLQVIEFNEFFDRLSAPEPGPVEHLQRSPDDAWREFLAQAPLRVTTDGEPALMRPVAAAVPLPEEMPGTPGRSLPTGESLPADGKPLPRPSAATLPPEIPVRAARAPLPQPAELPREAARAALDVTGARPPLPDEARPVADSARVREIATPDSALPRTVAAAPATPADAKSIPPRIDAAVAIRMATPGTDPTSAPRMSAPAERLAAAIPTRVATTSESTLATDAALRQPTPPALRAAGPGPLALRDGHAGVIVEPTLTPPRGAASLDAAPVNAARSAHVSPPIAPGAAAPGAAAPGVVETPAADALPMRGNEVPAPSSATGAPSANAAGTPVAIPTPAAPGVATPGTNPAPLPPQLESLALPRQADAADWGNGLGERVSWMIDQRRNSATIRLDPPALGKLDVQVRVADDATTITIQAQHAPTRELIEASATRLRDFLQESGFQNVNVDVSQRQDQQQARAQATPDARRDGDDASPQSDQSESTPGARQPAGEGASLVDTFA